MLIFEYPFWIVSIDQCIKQKNTINNKIHRYYQTEIIPYCSGRWSRTLSTGSQLHSKTRLNPYCRGRWSRTDYWKFKLITEVRVLILIVVEDGLVHAGRKPHAHHA